MCGAQRQREGRAHALRTAQPHIHAGYRQDDGQKCDQQWVSRRECGHISGGNFYAPLTSRTLHSKSGLTQRGVCRDPSGVRGLAARPPRCRSSQPQRDRVEASEGAFLHWKHPEEVSQAWPPLPFLRSQLCWVPSLCDRLCVTMKKPFFPPLFSFFCTNDDRPVMLSFIFETAQPQTGTI